MASYGFRLQFQVEETLKDFEKFSILGEQWKGINLPKMKEILKKIVRMSFFQEAKQTEWKNRENRK